MVGQKLGHYNITKELGHGGRGAAYLADDTRLKRQVAVKVLPESVSKDPERLRRFRIEAEAAAQLNHPNIAQIFSFEDVDGPDGTSISIIVMEYVPGQTLTDHIAAGSLPLDRFYDWFIPLSDALAHAHAHAHEQGVTHRDLKPANIMTREDGTPKILDFGLARIVQTSDPLDIDAPTPTMDDATKKGTFLGTPAYMSPEQASMQEVDHRTDIFSFGSVMYGALTGKRAGCRGNLGR